MNVMTDTLNAAALAQLQASGGPLIGLYVGLATNNPSFSHVSVAADITEPSYTGYARQAVVFGSPYQRVDGSFAVQGTLLQFQMGNTALPTVINAYAVFSAITAGTLMWGETLPNPIGLVSTTDAVILTIEFSLPNLNNAAATIVQ